MTQLRELHKKDELLAATLVPSGTLRIARSRKVRYPILPNQNDFSSPCSLLESPLPMTYVTLRYHNDGILFLLEVSKFNIVQPRVLLVRLLGKKANA